MKDMKSRVNVDNKLSLILRIAIVLLIKLIALSASSVRPSEPSESKSALVSGNASLISIEQPLSRWLRSENIVSGSLRPQFVSEALPISQSVFLPNLVNSSIPDPIAESLRGGTNGCELIASHTFCSCYALDKRLFIDCKITAINQMKEVLSELRAQPIKSFSLNGINDTLNSLPERLFQEFSAIEQMYICLPSLVTLSNQSLVGLETSLKALSLVNSKLTAVPKQALSRLKSLETLDLGSNEISAIESYAFSGLPLVSVNLQSNLIDSLLEYSLAGLENTLVELVLIGNRIDQFPIDALRHLPSLETLKLQSNRISSLPDDAITRFSALKSLDLQSNLIDELDSHSFIATPNLLSLSVANNRLTVLNETSVFEQLLDLENLDLSHNELRVIHLKNVKSLRTLDLSSNNLEEISFHNLPNLKEVFISNNNITKLSNWTFINSTSLSVIFLQHNAIQTIDYNTFDALDQLLTLDLSYNQLRAIDPLLLKHNTHLQSLYLDNNLISYIGLEAGSFQLLVRLLTHYLIVYHFLPPKLLSIF